MKQSRFLLCCALLFVLSCIRVRLATAQTGYVYGRQPGKAEVTVSKNNIVLKNAILMAEWQMDRGNLGTGSFGTPGVVDGERLLDDVFRLVFADGKTLKASSMRMDAPRMENLEANEHAARLEEHFRGRRVVVRLEDPASKLVAIWSVELRDGGNYIRQEVTFSSPTDSAIREVRLFDFKLLETQMGAQVVGSVKGSPVTAGNMFLGFEHPLSQCTVERRTQVRCSIQRELPLKAGQTVKYSSVIGISPVGQMRRGFLNYVERERAHPYRPFLHYNSWYDIGYGNRYDQAAALDVIHAFGEELNVKRGVKIDSFMFDDGWDDPRSLWNFDSGFPDGFSPIKAAAAKYGAAPGIWLSPWGGYDKAKDERIKYGGQQGFETNEGGFALSGPKYFTRFREVTLDFIRKYGINQFKIDGTGNVNSVFPGSAFDSDFHAAISLIGEWRALKPDIFVNLTTGTYPSPFWLRYADSIWRGGDDNWSRRNAATLVDTHWIGGDPAKLEVYGWAAWSPEKGIITLRNPSDRPQSFSLDVGRAFELPTGAAQKFTAHSPWKSDAKQTPVQLTAGEAHIVELLPFEVLNLEAIPGH